MKFKEIVYDSMQPHQLYFAGTEEPFSTIAVEFDIRGFITEKYIIRALNQIKLKDGFVMDKKLKVGVIGTGSGGRYLFSVLSENPNVEGHAVCDIAPAAPEFCKDMLEEKKIEGVKFFNTVEEMYASDVEAVICRNHRFWANNPYVNAAYCLLYLLLHLK